MSNWIELDDSHLSGLGRINLRLNRGERRNALTRQMLSDLNDVLARIEQLPNARVLVLQAAGSVFCAGMDLGEMQQHASAPDREQQWQLDSELYCQVLTRLFRLPLPTIAQVQGPALAGGIGLVLACDMVLCAEDAFFALPEPVRGIAAAIVTPFLIFRVGHGVAGQWLLSGQRISAKIASSAGLCYTVAGGTDLSEQVDRLVIDVLSGAPAALAITKRHWQECSGAANVVAQAQASIAVSAEARQTADAREGLAAFLEKRPPTWARN